MGWDRNSFLFCHPTDLEKWALTQQSSWVGSSWFYHMCRSLTPTDGLSWPWPFLRPYLPHIFKSCRAVWWDHWESCVVFQLSPDLFHYGKYIGVERASSISLCCTWLLCHFSFLYFEPPRHILFHCHWWEHLLLLLNFFLTYRYLFSFSIYKILKY